jgi:hypothetical protein
MTQARTLVAIFASAHTSSGLVLWNRLGSAAEVSHSAVGSNGLNCTGSFVPGVFGNAVEVSAQYQAGVSFPAALIPRPAGCIEFWAKLSGISGTIPAGNCVNLAGVADAQGAFSGALDFNGNDGSANGGLCARLGNIGSAGTGTYGY